METNVLKGDSTLLAFERMYQSAHLNAVYNTQNLFGTELLVFSSSYGRLGEFRPVIVPGSAADILAGQNQISGSYCDVLLDCYQQCTPVEEILRAFCKNAYSVRLEHRPVESLY